MNITNEMVEKAMHAAAIEYDKQDEDTVFTPSVFRAALESVAAYTRRAAFEECTKICEDRAAHRWKKYLDAINSKNDKERARLQSIAQSEANLCADAIRTAATAPPATD